MSVQKKSLKLLQVQEKSERDYYRNSSNIPKEYLDYKWVKDEHNSKFYDPKFTASTDISVVNTATIESRTRARDEALKYASNIKENYKNGVSLLFIGGQRSGKTVLATLILREAINKLVGSVYFVPFIQLIVESNVYFKADIEEYTAQYIDPDILCIDDIDSLRETSNKFKEYFDYILTSRRLARKPTIITSRIPVSKMRSMIGDGVYALLNDRSLYSHINIISRDLDFEDVDILSMDFDFELNGLVEKLKEHYRKSSNKSVISSVDIHDILKECIVLKKSKGFKK